MRRHALRTLPFELDPGPGLIAVDAPETVWRQARQLTGQGGCRLRIRRLERRHSWRWELRIDDAGEAPLALLRSPGDGALAGTARRLIEYGHDLLFDSLPW